MRPFLTNLQFGTRPVVVHAQGPDLIHPLWPEIRDRFFTRPRQRIGPIDGLTILTWNNGHPAMGLLERSLEHLGIPCMVTGRGIADWVNSRDKPNLTREALARIETPWVMGVDSADAIVVGDPSHLVELLESHFRCELVFGADKVSYPGLKCFKEFEDGLPGAAASDFRYLNGGVWLGRTAFCREFFGAACDVDPAAVRPKAEQGILKRLLPRFSPRVQLDYTCAVVQNLGFVFQPVWELAA